MAPPEEQARVSFSETVAHLGGLPVLAGAVLLLLVLYLVLVEWFLPRARAQRTLHPRYGFATKKQR